MKIRVIGVKHFPEKNCFAVVLHGGSVDSAKFRTYGVNPVDKFCRDMSLFDKAVASIGKDVDIIFDMRGAISSIGD